VIVYTPNVRYSFECRDGSPSDALVVRETWVENVYRIHREDITDGGVMLDIGANIGAVSVYGASLGAYVVAVEPEPDNRLYLERNMRQVDTGYRILPVAIGDRDGAVKLVPAHGNSHISDVGTVDVRMMTLEAALEDAGVGQVDVCKIDIEGSEYPLIEATPRDVLRRIRYLTMEFDARPLDVFGAMVSKLACDFGITILGSPERGGYIYARRYDD